MVPHGFASLVLDEGFVALIPLTVNHTHRYVKELWHTNEVHSRNGTLCVGTCVVCFKCHQHLSRAGNLRLGELCLQVCIRLCSVCGFGRPSEKLVALFRAHSCNDNREASVRDTRIDLLWVRSAENPNGRRHRNLKLLQKNLLGFLRHLLAFVHDYNFVVAKHGVAASAACQRAHVFNLAVVGGVHFLNVWSPLEERTLNVSGNDVGERGLAAAVRTLDEERTGHGATGKLLLDNSESS